MRKILPLIMLALSFYCSSGWGGFFSYYAFNYCVVEPSEDLAGCIQNRTGENLVDLIETEAQYYSNGSFASQANPYSTYPNSFIGISTDNEEFKHLKWSRFELSLAKPDGTPIPGCKIILMVNHPTLLRLYIRKEGNNYRCGPL